MDQSNETINSPGNGVSVLGSAEVKDHSISSVNVEVEESIKTIECDDSVAQTKDIIEEDQNNQNNSSANIDAEVSITSTEQTEIEEIPEKNNVEENSINNLADSDETKEEIIDEDSKEPVGSVKDTIISEEVDAKEEVSEEEAATEEIVGEDVVDQAKFVEINEEEISNPEAISFSINDQENVDQINNEVNDQNILSNEQQPVNIEKPFNQNELLEIDPQIMAQLENYLDNNGVTNYNISTESGSNVGDNMLGVIAKVTINGLDKTGSNAELKWIMKIAPGTEMLRKMINVQAFYENEAMMYKTIFPIFKKLENEKSIVHGFDSYPQFLFSFLEPLKETIVMQDMKALGYVLRNRKEPLNLDHVKLVMKTYGKFHALSYAFKYNNPDLYQALVPKLAGSFENAIDMSLVKQSQQILIDNAKSLLDPVRDSLALKKYSKYAENFMDIYLEACVTTNEYSIICHGDSWINNMLFKYDNSTNSDIPTDVCLLDFQLARSASPATDLSYFLFTCTTKALRDEHYDNMIQLYYYTLGGHLNDLGFDPEKCLSFDALQAELKRYSITGLYMSMMALIGMTRDSDELPDWQKTKDEEEMGKKFAIKSRNEEDYNERIRNIIIEYAQRGYFDFLF